MNPRAWHASGMRVVAGTLGGRSLATPRGKGTRPTSGLIRGAIFNSLDARGLLHNARVADLFAGSGALGIEALSRGAERVVFVESDRAAADVIDANLKTLGLGPPAAKTTRSTVERWAGGDPGPLDLVLADPPYEWDGWEQLLDALVGYPTAYAVLESDREIAHSAWDVAAVHHHGGTVVTQLWRGGRGARGARTR